MKGERSSIIPLKKGEFDKNSPRKIAGGATGSDREQREAREMFRNEKVFLTEKNPFSWLPLTVFLIILDN